jgi:3-dehydroquinate synthase
LSAPAPISVPVSLGDRSYDVLVGTGLLARCGALLRDGALRGRCAVISDSIVAPLYAKRVLNSLSGAGFDATLHEVPSGEASKSLVCVGQVCEEMIAAGHDRKSFVIALGGGVVGDLAGFVAAIYYRGIPYVQAPTTVVAQVDSSVGGKTGVNARGGKNLIGAFHQPRLVVADTETLATLPPREFNEGLAEVVKHAIIRDRELFEALERIDRDDLAPLIARNVAIKAAIVAEDETETTGTRALLNFGHTIGHAIENAAGYGKFLHGEAISLGIVAAARLSVSHAGLPGEEAERIIGRLASFDLPTKLDREISTDSLLSAMARDKKFDVGRVRFVVAPTIGEARLIDTLTLDDLRRAVDGLKS